MVGDGCAGVAVGVRGGVGRVTVVAEVAVTGCVGVRCIIVYAVGVCDGVVVDVGSCVVVSLLLVLVVLVLMLLMVLLTWMMCVLVMLLSIRVVLLLLLVLVLPLVLVLLVTLL